MLVPGLDITAGYGYVDPEYDEFLSFDNITGAISDKKGLFQEADGGTIFLDEVSSMSPTLQSRLLRVLQEKEIQRVGVVQDDGFGPFRLLVVHMAEDGGANGREFLHREAGPGQEGFGQLDRAHRMVSAGDGEGRDPAPVMQEGGGEQNIRIDRQPLGLCRAGGRAPVQRVAAMKNRLRVLRAEREWSQQDLAERLGVSRQSVNAIETGRYDPSLPLAFRIAEVFGLPIEDIFQKDEAA